MARFTVKFFEVIPIGSIPVKKFSSKKKNVLGVTYIGCVKVWLFPDGNFAGHNHDCW